MKESNELFELCKQVYEATGWKYTIGRFHDDGSYDGYVGHKGVAYTPNPQDAEWLPKNIPLYTSDYLLEKLPVYLMYSGEQYFFELEVFEDKTWRGNYGYQDRDGWYDHPDINLQPEDTPLKALLKLALKLHEEKIL